MTKSAHYASPIFYDDLSATRLLKQAPRHVNVFKLDNDLWPNGRYITGPAHYRRTLADDNLHNYAGRAVYRIVVKLKAVQA